MMRKHWHLLAAGLTAVMLFCTACGASSSDTASAVATQSAAAVWEEAGFQEAAADYAVDNTAEAPAAPAEDAGSAANTAAAIPDERKIVRHSYLELETKDFDQAVETIGQLVAEQGGYIESQSLSGQSLRNNSYYERHAQITARVPSENLDAVTATLGDLCNVVSQSESRQDITDSYYDAQAHLDTLQLQEERLLEILSKAEKLEDVITLESALSDVRYQIESLTATLKRMDSQVTYSDLNISLEEVVEYQEQISTPKTFGERFSQSLRRGGNHLVSFIQGGLLFAAETLPVILFLVLVVLVILFIIIGLGRRNARRRQAKFQAQQPKQPDPPKPPQV